MQAAELNVYPNPSIQTLYLCLHWRKPGAPRRTQRRLARLAARRASPYPIHTS